MSEPNGTLILGWGNPGRVDDGLGPALAAAIDATAPPDVTVEVDYQLQIENAAEVARYERVLFVDADRSGETPYSIRRLEPGDSRLSFSTHSVAPEAILALSKNLFDAEPEAWLLGIRGYEFDDFGERLSTGAQENLEAAIGFVRAACAGAGFDQPGFEGAAAHDTSGEDYEEDSCKTKND